MLNLTGFHEPGRLDDIDVFYLHVPVCQRVLLGIFFDYKEVQIIQIKIQIWQPETLMYL